MYMCHTEPTGVAFCREEIGDSGCGGTRVTTGSMGSEGTRGMSALLLELDYSSSSSDDNTV